MCYNREMSILENVRHDVVSSPEVPQIALGIRDDIVASYKDELVSVLLYGSSLKHDVYWDLDMLILLKTKRSPIDDLKTLKDIQTKYADQTLDLQLFYVDETTSPNLFSLDAHGAFFVSILATAKTLHGDNPFAYYRADEELIAISLLNRIQRYIFQARQEYIGNERYIKDKNPQYHAKHVRRCMLDLLLLAGVRTNNEFVDDHVLQRFPMAFSSSDLKMLTSNSDSVADFMVLYEKIYEESLRLAHTLVPPTTNKPHRAALDGLVFEYALPSNKHASTAVIIVDGLPSLPDQRAFINLLASWGYAVFFPRLKGTWESGGIFLDHDPASDIIQLAENLKYGLHGVTDSVVTFDTVLVLGVSFGGSIALHASLSTAVDRAFALSPVIKMSNVENIDTLGPYISSHFSGAYRCSETDWDALIRDDIYLSLPELLSDRSFDGTKCTVIIGIDDPQISAVNMKALCKANNITCIPLATQHLSLHKNTTLVRPLLYELLQEKNPA